MADARVTDTRLNTAFDEGRGVAAALKTYVILGVGDEPKSVAEWPFPLPAVAMVEMTQHLAQGDGAFAVVHVGADATVGVVPDAIDAGLSLVKRG